MFCLGEYLARETVNQNVSKEYSRSVRMLITKMIAKLENIREIFQNSENVGILQT
jgi:hypothetical protein